MTCVCRYKCMSNCIVNVYILCMDMRERLVIACIDMYESGPTSARTPKEHGVRISTLIP